MPDKGMRHPGQKTTVSLVQITAGNVGLYGLDKNGTVWQYHPADYNHKPPRWAFWSRLTAFGRDATRHRESTTYHGDDEEDPSGYPTPTDPD